MEVLVLSLQGILRGKIKTTDKDIAKTALLAKGHPESEQTSSSLLKKVLGVLANVE